MNKFLRATGHLLSPRGLVSGRTGIPRGHCYFEASAIPRANKDIYIDAGDLTKGYPGKRGEPLSLL